jgi:D-beta-D-heptose 7-phosphate kinase/D-beta-D-heptose 1-phosphate adenosyltransferase
VTFFGEDTPLQTIEELLPDVLVKGDEYAPEDIVGAGFVESSGGRVVRVKMVGGFSTSALIKRMRGDP